MSSNINFLVPESFHTKFGSERHSSFWENPVWILYVHYLVSRSRNDLDLQYSHNFINLIRCLHLPTFRSLVAIVPEKSTVFTFFLWKSPNNKIWPSLKIGQGQPRVIIWTIYNGLEFPMLHTKFRGNPSTSSGEEDFWRVFTIYGRGGHLGHVIQMLRTTFRSPYQRRLRIKLGFDWPSGFRKEDVWNC